jgi:hypothetical protein
MEKEGRKSGTAKQRRAKRCLQNARTQSRCKSAVEPKYFEGRFGGLEKEVLTVTTRDRDSAVFALKFCSIAAR